MAYVLVVYVVETQHLHVYQVGVFRCGGDLTKMKLLLRYQRHLTKMKLLLRYQRQELVRPRVIASAVPSGPYLKLTPGVGGASGPGLEYYKNSGACRNTLIYSFDWRL